MNAEVQSLGDQLKHTINMYVVKVNLIDSMENSRPDTRLGFALQASERVFIALKEDDRFNDSLYIIDQGMVSYWEQCEESFVGDELIETVAEHLDSVKLASLKIDGKPTMAIMLTPKEAKEKPGDKHLVINLKKKNARVFTPKE